MRAPSFFERDAAPVEEQPDCRGYCLHAALSGKALPDLCKRDVRCLLDEAKNEGLVRVELRTRRLPLLTRFLLAASRQVPAVEIPIRKRRAASRVEIPSSIAAITRPRRSALRLLVISTSSQITRSNESDNARRVNPQTDSAFSEDALEQRGQVAGAVHDANDVDKAFGLAIQDQIFSDRHRPRIFGNFGSQPTGLRKCR